MLHTCRLYELSSSWFDPYITRHVVLGRVFGCNGQMGVIGRKEGMDCVGEVAKRLSITKFNNAILFNKHKLYTVLYSTNMKFMI